MSGRRAQGADTERSPLAANGSGYGGNPFEDSGERYDSSDPESGQGQYVQQVEEYKPWIIRYITAISRSAGIATVVVLWSFTGLLLKNASQYKYAPWYMLAISILVTFFEVIWVVNKIVIVCMRQDGCCCRFWRFLVWIDTWRKTILYAGFAVPCFLNAIIITETIISGLLLLVTAALYFIKSFKDSTCVNRKRYKHAIVQTSPKTSTVSHGVQLGKNGSSPPNYRATHTEAQRVQPRDSQQVSSESPSMLDPAGRKRQRYTSQDEERRGSPAPPPRSPEPADRDGRDYYDNRDRRDRYDDRDGRDRYDDRDRRDRYDDRDSRDRYKDKNLVQYDIRGRKDYDDQYRYRHDSPDGNRRDERRPREDRYRDSEDDRRSSQRDRYGDRTRAASPPSQYKSPDYRRKEELKPSEKKKEQLVKAEPAPVTKSEPPPLKELPEQASEAMKKSAAAGLVKQVASGSPIQTHQGSTPSGMPTKLEQKAAKMSNPYEQSKAKSTNPFDEPDEDEYFD